MGNDSKGEGTSEALTRLRSEDDNFSDFTINCNGKTFRVHRIIIAGASRFFEKACKGQFKEGQERTMSLDDDDPKILSLMLGSFYTRNIPGWDKAIGVVNALPILTLAKLYVMADKYDCRDLMRSVLSAIQSKHHEAYLHDESFRTWKRKLSREMPPAVRYVYQHTVRHDDPLRAAAVDLICWRSRGGARLAIHRDTWLELTKEVPEFVADVLGAKYGDEKGPPTGSKASSSSSAPNDPWE